jgi:hypothetical protein
VAEEICSSVHRFTYGRNRSWIPFVILVAAVVGSLFIIGSASSRRAIGSSLMLTISILGLIAFLIRASWGRERVEVRPYGATLPRFAWLPTFRFVLYAEMRALRLLGGTLEIETKSGLLAVHRHEFEDRAAFESFVQALAARWESKGGVWQAQSPNGFVGALPRSASGEIKNREELPLVPVAPLRRYEFFYAKCYRGRWLLAAVFVIGGYALMLIESPGEPRWSSSMGIFLILAGTALYCIIWQPTYGPSFGRVPEVRLTDHAAVVPFEQFLSRRYVRVAYSQIVAVEREEGILRSTKLRITTTKGIFLVLSRRMRSPQDFEVFALVLMQRQANALLRVSARASEASRTTSGRQV